MPFYRCKRLILLPISVAVFYLKTIMLKLYNSHFSLYDDVEQFWSYYPIRWNLLPLPRSLSEESAPCVVFLLSCGVRF